MTNTSGYSVVNSTLTTYKDCNQCQNFYRNSTPTPTKTVTSTPGSTITPTPTLTVTSSVTPTPSATLVYVQNLCPSGSTNVQNMVVYATNSNPIMGQVGSFNGACWEIFL